MAIGIILTPADFASFTPNELNSSGLKISLRPPCGNTTTEIPFSKNSFPFCITSIKSSRELARATDIGSRARITGPKRKCLEILSLTTKVVSIKGAIKPGKIIDSIALM